MTRHDIAIYCALAWAFLLGMALENWRLGRRLDKVVNQVRGLGREFAEAKAPERSQIRREITERYKGSGGLPNE